jgi:glycosyltransferase involved in cell wall biosynthesis
MEHEVKETPIRVALFPDSLREVNGVANTFRHFADYARKRDMPLLVVHGSAPDGVREDGSVRFFGLKRGPISFPVEKDLRFDVAFVLHLGRVQEELRRFRPDVVHITGPSDIGMLGAIAAHRLGIPLAASWHTNIHEYAAKRVDRILPKWLLRGGARSWMLNRLEETAFQLLMLHFKLARFYFAPNPELVERLQTATKKHCWLMERGIDLDLFGPQKRTRKEDGEFVIGYVGRLSTEKMIRSFAPLAQALSKAGHRHVRFVFVGHGSEEKWLEENIPGVRLTGVLKGEALSRAYADLDLFIFFSDTDTFGNAVLEALASGVPAVVSDKGGPKFIVKEGCGIVCASDDEFLRAALRLIEDQSLLRAMSLAARRRAELASWDAVFDAVYCAYGCELREKNGAFENKALASASFTQNA